MCVRADVDVYHTSDQELLAAKKRLLQPASLDNSTEVGGIRARMETQLGEFEDVHPDLKVLHSGVRLVSTGFANVDPLEAGLEAQYSQIVTAVNAFVNKLDSLKGSSEKKISQFAKDWSSLIKQRIEDDPQVNQGAFAYYNAFVVKMYGLLNQVSKSVSSNLRSGTNTEQRSLQKAMSAQNTTHANLNKQIVNGNAAFTSTLNQKTLPKLVATKYDEIANIARLRKAIVDSLDTLKAEILPGLTDRGNQYLQTGKASLLADEQKQITAFTNSMQKQLLKMTAMLSAKAQTAMGSVSRNLTSIEQQQATGSKQLGSNRKVALANVDSMVANSVGLLTNFQSDVLDSARQVDTMAAAGSQALTAAQAQSQMENSQLDSQTSAAIARLFGPSLGSSGSIDGINAVQSSIANMNTAGMTSLSSSLSTSVKAQAAHALSDAEEASSDLSGQVSAVVSGTQTTVGAALGGKIGVATMALESSSDSLGRRMDSAATDARASLDAAVADNEDDQASIVSKFQADSNSKDKVTASLGTLAEKIRQRKLDGQSSLGASGADLVNAVSGSASTMAGQAADADALAKLVDSMGGFSAIDSENEARINSAFSQLNSLRRLGASNGDLLQTNTAGTVSALVGQVPRTGVDGGSSLVKDLSGSVSGVKAASLAYASQAASFEANMRNQMKVITANATMTVANNTPMSQIVTHAQMDLSSAGRALVRNIYATGRQGVASTNPKLNVNKYLHYLLNDTKFGGIDSAVSAQMRNLSSVGAKTKLGIGQYTQYLEQMKNRIVDEYFFNFTSDDPVGKLVKFKNSSIEEVANEKENLNTTILDHFAAINGSIANKTTNFYKQFQTASIVADSIVMGFSDYIDKMITVEKMSAQQRTAIQDQIIQSIQDGANSMPTNISSASDIDRVNRLVAMAANASDTSAAGNAARAAARQALVALVGTSAAVAMEDRFSKLSANADALSKSIDASASALVADRVDSVGASQTGVDGINESSRLFSNQAGDVLETQEKNAKELEGKIDALLSGSAFLTNVSASEFGEILNSIQASDSLHSSQQSGYQESAGQQVATLGGVVESFSKLVTIEINKTTDFINQLSANYTDLIKRTDAVTIDPVNSVKAEIEQAGSVASGASADLDSHMLSIGPIEDGLGERTDILKAQQDEFAKNTRNQLADIVASVHQMDSDIATSRAGGMQKLNSAVADLLEDFGNSALDLQSQNVPSSFLSEGEIKLDMSRRMKFVRTHLAQ